MATYRVKDYQITASSKWDNHDNILPKFGRLYRESSGGAWIAHSSGKRMFILQSVELLPLEEFYIDNSGGS